MKVGRPKIKAADRKVKTIMVRVTSAEYTALQKEAKKADVPLARYIVRFWRERKK